MRLGVTGTRQGLSPGQWRVADSWLEHNAERVAEFHYGDCVGVDEQILWKLIELVQPYLFIYPASVSERWRARTLEPLQASSYSGGIIQYEPLPPMLRNGYIAEACDFLIAFPGSGRGTWDCIGKARKLGREGFICLRNGEVEKL